MAVAEYIRPGKSESFEEKGQRQRDSETEKRRVRLSNSEAGYVRYVLSEWDGECGLASCDMERAAARPDLIRLEREREEQLLRESVPDVVVQAAKASPKSEQLLNVLMGTDLAPKEPIPITPAVAAIRKSRKNARQPQGYSWRKAWENDQQSIHVHASRSSSYHGHEMLCADTWLERMIACPRRGKEKPFGWHVKRAWHALKELSDTPGSSWTVVVLNALYGPKPPGLLSEIVWDKSVNAEYVRVVRFLDEAGPTTADLEERLRVDKRKHDSETESAHKQRVLGATLERTKLVINLGRSCEKLITGATNAYIGALSP